MVILFIYMSLTWAEAARRLRERNPILPEKDLPENRAESPEPKAGQPNAGLCCPLVLRYVPVDKKTHLSCVAPQCGQNEKSIGSISSQDTHFFSVAVNCPQAGQNLCPVETSFLQLVQITTVPSGSPFDTSSFLRLKAFPNAFVTLPLAVAADPFAIIAALDADSFVPPAAFRKIFFSTMTL